SDLRGDLAKPGRPYLLALGRALWFPLSLSWHALTQHAGPLFLFSASEIPVSLGLLRKKDGWRLKTHVVQKARRSRVASFSGPMCPAMLHGPFADRHHVSI